MKKLKITVVIPTLNEEHFLPHLLSSLAIQTDPDFEVIVVDGNSEDRTIAVAKTYADRLPQLQVVTGPVRCLPDQRNFGASLGKGDWFVFSDADNIFLPYAIERIRAYIEEHTAVQPQLLATWCRPDTDTVGDAFLALFSNMIIEGSLSVKRQFSPGPLTIVSRWAFDRVGGYTNGLKWGEDVDFGNKMQKSGIRLSVIREVLYVWSMRRFRNEGKLKFAQQAVKAAFYVLLTNKALTSGYEMGGHLYKKKKKPKNASVLKKLTIDVKKLLQEVFE